MRVDEKVHGTRQPQGQFHHVQDRLVLVQPHVVVRNGHGLEGDGFGVLEEGVWAPHVLQPFHFEEPVGRGLVVIVVVGKRRW